MYNFPRAPRPRIRHLTLLHSNDLHGDFLAETLDNKLVGGVSLLSGYVNKTRQECPNTLYMIAGDMFRGSLIDSEFQGISTIEIMNALGPDLVSLGNHEMDYGIAHLLFLERCCKFPIVNANIYIKTNGMRLFQSHKILKIDGMKILVIGIITEEIMGRANKDTLLGTFVNVKSAAEEIKIICNSYRHTDIDFTILLTHIGFDHDVALAQELDPALGVDIIIGGHSHTLPEEPVLINGIRIVQAGIGTDYIGRFEIDIDTEQNAISSCTWRAVPIDQEHCTRNEALEQLIYDYKKITDAKYGAVLTTLTSAATHPNRYQETTAGNLFCDIMQDMFQLDIVMLGSGSLRQPEFGPIVTAGSLLNMYSFDERLLQMRITGKELKAAMLHVLRNAPTHPEGHGEYYQLSRGCRFVYSTTEDRLTEASFQGCSIPDEAVFSVGIEGYHTDNLTSFLGLDREVIQTRFPWRTATSNIRTAAEEYLRGHVHLTPRLEGRTQILP